MPKSLRLKIGVVTIEPVRSTIPAVVSVIAPPVAMVPEKPASWAAVRTQRREIGAGQVLDIADRHRRQVDVIVGSDLQRVVVAASVIGLAGHHVALRSDYQRIAAAAAGDGVGAAIAVERIGGIRAGNGVVAGKQDLADPGVRVGGGDVAEQRRAEHEMSEIWYRGTPSTLTSMPVMVPDSRSSWVELPSKPGKSPVNLISMSSDGDDNVALVAGKSRSVEALRIQDAELVERAQVDGFGGDESRHAAIQACAARRQQSPPSRPPLRIIGDGGGRRPARAAERTGAFTAMAPAPGARALAMPLRSIVMVPHSPTHKLGRVMT